MKPGRQLHGSGIDCARVVLAVADRFPRMKENSYWRAHGVAEREHRRIFRDSAGGRAPSDHHQAERHVRAW
jgi:hypothetical protein